MSDQLPVTAPDASPAPVGVPVLHTGEQIDGDFDITVIARYPYQMEKCQNALIDWARRKIANVSAETKDLEENLEIAKKNKWGTGGLHRAWQRSLKTLAFYEKILAALQAGHCIVPNFPVDIIAVRTKKKNPAKGRTWDAQDTHKQASECPPIGEGEFKAADPVVFQRSLEYMEGDKLVKAREYAADAWADLEFPFTTAKPEILSATQRAMQDKFFDEIGVLPGKSRKQDPIIVGRIYDPRSTKSRDLIGWRRHGEKRHERFVTFLIAWFVDTRTI